MKTRAAVLTSMGSPRPYVDTRPLEIRELELDPPGSGELLVRIEAAGVCHSDLSVVDGNRPRPLPMALGHEAAGVVEAVGRGTTGVVEGDHVVLTFVPSCGRCPACAGGSPVMCLNAAAANAEGRMLGGGFRLHGAEGVVHHHLGVSAFSERAVVAQGSAVVVPPDVPFEIAALFGCAVLTGVGAVLNTAEVRPGDSAAVFGLGGVGLSAVLGAVLAAAHPVIAVDPVESKRSLALELGADVAVAPEQAGQVIDDMTHGGADFTFEAAGHPDVLAAAYRATGRGGTTVAIGLPHPDLELRLPAVSIVGEARTIKGSYMGSSEPQADLPRLIGLWAAGRLPVEKLYSGTSTLDDINEVFDALAEGRVVRQVLQPTKEEA